MNFEENNNRYLSPQSTRKATINDLEEIQILFKETIKECCKNDYIDLQIQQWISSIENNLKWQTFIKDQFFLLSESNNRITGFCSLKNGHILDTLYVHKDYQRKGIATLLYNEIKIESKRLNNNNLIANVSITARPFFENKGFKIVKKNINLINGVEIINYKMSQTN